MNNLEKAIKLVEDKISGCEEIILDLFGGLTSQVTGAINYDVGAEEGIRGDVSQLLEIFPPNSVSEIIASGPQTFFLEQAAIILKSGGRIYIDANRSNPFARLPDADTLSRIRLRVILENGNLEPRFANQQFFRQIPRPDGSYNIPLPTIRTSILEKEA